MELFGVSIKKIFKRVCAYARARARTRARAPPPLSTVSEVVNNSPKRNLNTMNLGD